MFFEHVPNFPTPADSLPFTYEHNFPFTVLRHRNGSPNATLTVLKDEIRRFVDKHTPPSEPHKATPIPDNISIAERSLVSQTSSFDSKMFEKNEKLISFLSILYSSPTYDRAGSVGSLTPTQLTDEDLKLLKNSSSNEEKTYLSKRINFPFMSQTVLTYFLQGYHHLHAIDQDIASIKKSFNVLVLLNPPDREEYTKYVNASKNNEVESILDHPSE